MTEQNTPNGAGNQLTVADNLDALSKQAFEALLQKGQWSRTLALSNAVGMLYGALTPDIMRPIMSLQNTRLGFKTDLATGYDENTVKNCLIEAVTWGLNPVGNQFNILGGNTYVTKEGLTHLLRTLPGLTDLKVTTHPANIHTAATKGYDKKTGTYYDREEADCTVDVSCKYHGKNITEKYTFVIRVNKGMGQDAVLGKAERKAKAKLYAYLTESNITFGDLEDMEPARDVTPRDNAPQGAAAPKSSPLKAKKVVDAEIVDEQPTAPEQALQTPTQEPVAPATATRHDAWFTDGQKPQTDTTGAFDHLHGMLKDAGKKWADCSRVLTACGVQVPSGASKDEFDKFAAWVMGEKSLMAELQAKLGIKPTLI